MGGCEGEGVWEGGVRGICMGEFEGYVCRSGVCGNVVYVGVRGGYVNGEGIGIENMFHY